MVGGGGEPGVWSELFVVGQDVPLLTPVTSLTHLLRVKQEKGTLFKVALFCSSTNQVSQLMNNSYCEC